MIKDYRIIAATTLTNAEIGGYYPTSHAALASIQKNSFIDKVIVAEGFSIDRTVELHQNISSKIEFLSQKKWDFNEWGWRNLYDQYDVIYEYCREKEDKCILIYHASDQVWTDDYAQEMEKALTDLIESNKDFFLVPFCKTINYEFRTKVYDLMPNFYLHSAVKFEPDRRWTGVRGPDGMESTKGENTLVGEKNPERLNYRFGSFPISYDMFMFKREHLQHKINRYGRAEGSVAVQAGPPWPENLDEYITQIWLKKVISLHPAKLTLLDHPVEMRTVISSHLTEEHFGFNCFDHLAQQIGLGIV